MKFILGELPFIVRFSYAIAGKRLYLVFFAIALGTATEILGISLFLPLLNGGSGNDFVTSSIRSFFDLFSIPIEFTWVLLVLVVAMVLRFLLLLANDMLVAFLSAKITVHLSRRLFDAIGRSDFRYFSELNVGRINNTVTVEIPKITLSFEQMAATVTGLCFAVAYLTLAVVMSPFLAVVVLLSAPAIYVGISWSNRRIRKLSFEASSSSGHHQHWVIQVLQNVHYLRTTGAWDWFQSRVMNVTQRLITIRLKLTVALAYSRASLGIVSLLIVSLVLLHQVNVADLNVLDAIFILFLLKRAFDQMISVHATYRKMLSVTGSVHNYIDLVDNLEDEQEKVASTVQKADLTGSIELRDVTVQYQNRVQSIKGLNLVVNAGEWVALVGESGSGKSTALSVVTGLLKPDFGVATVADIEYAHIDANDFRKRIGYVPQDSAVFDDTFRNNLTLWDETINQTSIMEALEIAQLSEMVESLPDGLETMLGPNGTAISGGQRQRMSIAREILRDLDLLILDEATSAVDGPTERKIHQALRENRKSRTTILVAHRYETIRECDRIYVLKNGELMEVGVFEELYKGNGEFSRLVQLEQRDKRLA